MFDVKTIPANPVWARRLVKISEFKKLTLPSNVLDLAEQDLLDASDFNCELSQKQMSTLQYIVDRKHRAIILDDGVYESRKLTLLSLKKFEHDGPKVIFAGTSQYLIWAQLLSKYYPGEKIGIVHNIKLSNKSQFQELNNCHFETNFGGDEKWIITSYQYALTNNMMLSIKPSAIICEEVNGQHKVNQRFNDSLQGLFTETYACMFIYNISLVNQYDSVDFNTSIQQKFSYNSQNPLLKLLGYLCPIDNATRIFDMTKRNGIVNYLDSHGYRDIDMYKLLSLFGVCVDLIHQHPNDDNIVVLNNNALPRVRGGVNIKHHERGLLQYAKAEKELESKYKCTIQEVYRLEAAKPTLTNDVFNELKTNTWCNFKASYIKQLISQMAINQNKCLIIAENPALIRALRLSLDCDELSSSKHYDNCIARYIYPNPLWQDYAIDDIPPGHTKLCIGVQDLTQQDLVENTHIIILAEIPHSFTVYKSILEVCNRNGIKLYHPIITDSFEDYQYKSHSDKLKISKK